MLPEKTKIHMFFGIFFLPVMKIQTTAASWSKLLSIVHELSSKVRFAPLMINIILSEFIDLLYEHQQTDPKGLVWH